MKLLKLSIVALSLSVVVACKKKNDDPKPPTITGLSATSGNANTSITISGTNFSTTPASNTVRFGDIPATVTEATATSLKVTVPNGSTKGKVSVKVGTFTEVTSADDFTTKTFIDTRDQKEYGQALVGTQWWMAQNLNFDAPSNDFCYNDDAAKCTQYGKMYDWATANTSCPNGWRLPSEADYNTLINTLGGTTAAKNTLVGSVSAGGLGILYSGRKGNLGYAGEGADVNLWSSTEVSSTNAKSLFVQNSTTDVTIVSPSKTTAYCIRCIKN